MTDNTTGSWSQQIQQWEASKDTNQEIKTPETNLNTLLPAPSPQQLVDQVCSDKVPSETNFFLMPIESTQQKLEKKIEDGFCCVISMYDGVILFTTPSTTDSLGFPKDMLLGRSFIDFIHPKDRSTFASQITSGVAAPLTETKSGQKEVENSLYVMLRRYRSLKRIGYGITSKAVSYEPFKLVLTFKEAPEEPSVSNLNEVGPKSTSILLVICATPVKSVYKSEYF